MPMMGGATVAVDTGLLAPLQVLNQRELGDLDEVCQAVGTDHRPSWVGTAAWLKFVHLKSFVNKFCHPSRPNS